MNYFMNKFTKTFKFILNFEGTDFYDLNKGDLRSQEIPSTSTVSPVKGFKGYPR
jgi:hypothetical protein